ncbi:MAG: CoA transferase [Sphingomonadales bacterium]|nr:CoA transferase [Sphingomonadales bacterium]
MEILKGIKVVDVTTYAFVPAAGGVLAHWGAEVIKVESPKAPDPMRLIGGSLEPGRSSPTFQHYSRGKKSVGLDLSTDEGRALLYRLVADADVFLTSYLAPTRRKLKIDVDDIRAINPDVIYARGSGYGPNGPDADRPGFDAIAWWYRSSLGETAMKAADADWPVTMIGHGDGMSGLVLAGGICSALFHRERTGHALTVDGSLMGTATWFNGLELIGAQGVPITGAIPGEVRRHKAERKAPGGGAVAGFATMQIYQTADFRFINLLFLGDDDRDFIDLAHRIGLPELVTDPRYATSGTRLAHSADLRATLDAVFATKPLDEWRAILATARGAWAPIQSAAEALADPQTTANGYMARIAGGSFDLPIPAILFDEQGGTPPPAPDFAQHTDEVLAGIGVDADERARLRAAGVVA